MGAIFVGIECMDPNAYGSGWGWIQTAWGWEGMGRDGTGILYYALVV